LFHPFGFGFEQVLLQTLQFPRRTARKAGAGTRRILCFHENYSTGVGEVQKKTGIPQHAQNNCRSRATP
jgi:hypothetical protein